MGIIIEKHYPDHVRLNPYSNGNTTMGVCLCSFVSWKTVLILILMEVPQWGKGIHPG
mgnify:CR=1 FL=1